MRMKDENHAAEKAILERKLQDCQSTLPIYGLPEQKSPELNGPSNPMICSRCGDESSSLKQEHCFTGSDLPAQSPSMSVSETYEEHRIRVQHLTELLYEAELTGSRLTEQNRVLKEEIRRLTRNEERQRHFSNAEYLKNVVLKFHDARLSLLPVLTTMLSLSKEEAAELEKIAVSASDGTAGSSSFSSPWYGYLQRWSGGFS
ncbi:GRIP domain containing protein [Trichuris trichiura]|uniref:GRIP domain containing protein n=1 Tax=Trichuris trichiura TaxID=36087 RepID=A0A077Z2J9_TRITR|nr:GRIP domain containing protein [Trichuris trichiura]